MTLIKKRIHLRNIITKGMNMRHSTPGILKPLLNDMEHRGLVVPIMCAAKHKKSKRFYIADGFLRLNAYKILNNKRSPSRRRKTIDAYIQVNTEVVSNRINTVEYAHQINNESVNYRERRDNK